MGEPQVARTLKVDEFGRVEQLSTADGEFVIRRVTCGNGVPGTRWIARRLAARERVALAALEGTSGVARLLSSDRLEAVPSADGRVPRPVDVLLRSWVPGRPLHRAEELPRDFFDNLDALVAVLHRAGVCHNDLHKEQNVLVGEDGLPWLVDFQLASVHPRRGRRFRARVLDDLRHVEKHRRRYTRDGRGPAEAAKGAGHGLSRRGIARFWRRGVKPVTRALWGLPGLRALVRRADSEERRPSSGPWPRWTPPRGPRNDATIDRRTGVPIVPPR